MINKVSLYRQSNTDISEVLQVRGIPKGQKRLFMRSPSRALGIVYT
jgi:hypothetical protein